VPNDLSTPKPRSFLRWAGSKRQLLATLVPQAGTEWTRYVEPFAGSACLFFALQPDRALLGDINPDLILTYRQVKKAPAAVSAELGKWRKNRTTYLRLRAETPEHGTPARRAARFIYLNRCCFNGIYRTNRQGRFNVPYGGDRSGDLPDESLLRACARSLRRARLCPGDFSKVLAQVIPGDFVYMDPPFSIRSRRMFKEYDATMFGEDKLLQLRSWMDNFTERGIRWVVSYAMSDEAEFLRDGYRWSEVAVRRQIAGFSGNRKASSECLIHWP
jgi:DNA adenine methylase